MGKKKEKKKQKRENMLTVGILLVIFVAVSLFSYHQIVTSGRSSKLWGYAYLGEVPVSTDCTDCPTTIFYRDDDHIEDCTIQKVEIPAGGTAKDREITTLSLEQRQEERAGRKYIFSVEVYNKFEQVCWPEEETEIGI